MQYRFEGKIRNAYFCKPIENVLVIAKDVNENILGMCKSNKEGEYLLESDKNPTKISFQKDGYITKEYQIHFQAPELVRLLEDKIIGYQNKLWFNPGEEVDVFVHSSKKYNIQLLYHDEFTRVIKDFGNFDKTIQVVPDEPFVESGLDWIKTHSYKIPDECTPGFYSLDLSVLNEKQKYRISFVVTTSPELYGKNSKILLLASTNNWQTYNVWGGRSRYRNFEEKGKQSIKQKIYFIGVKFFPEIIRSKIKKIAGKNIVTHIQAHPNAWQFKKLSIKRPHPNCCIVDDDPMNPFTSHLTAGEWRVAAWLHKQKFNFDIVSGYELHKNPELIHNYNTFILNTHSEYWTKPMFSQLKEFGKTNTILNLSGNSIYREVDFPFEDESIRCVSLRFDKTVEDETQLIGVRFDMKGYGSCSGYKILKPEHWIFNGVEEKSKIFGSYGLNRPTGRSEGESFDPTVPGVFTNLSGIGASGWETDKLSDSAPKDFQLIAKGINRHNGGADMVIREKTHKNGMFFSASSITFGGSLLVDETCSAIIKNVLNKALSLNQHGAISEEMVA